MVRKGGSGSGLESGGIAGRVRLSGVYPSSHFNSQATLLQLVPSSTCTSLLHNRGFDACSTSSLRLYCPSGSQVPAWLEHDA